MTTQASERNTPLKEFMLSMSEAETWATTRATSAAIIDEVVASEKLSGIRRVYVIGHGTSFATSQLISAWITHIARIESVPQPAFNFLSYIDDYLLHPESTLVIGVSCSGNTASVVGGLAAANKRGAKTMIISGRQENEAARVSDWWIQTHADIERTVDAPAYSVSHLFIAMAGYLLAIGLGERDGTLDTAGASKWRADLDATISAMAALPVLFDEVGEISANLRSEGVVNICVLGTGPNMGTATEGALKISEFCWMFGAAEELEDFAHGRFREVDEKVALFIIAPDGAAIAKTKDLLVGCQRSRTPAIVFSDVNDAAISKLARTSVAMPEVPNEYLTPFIYIFPLWFFGWHAMDSAGGVVGEKRHGLLATDINFEKNFDADGNRKPQQ